MLSNIGLFVYLNNLPHLVEFIMDCNFDQGACEWVQDKADDMDWSVAYHDTGNNMMILQQNKKIIHSDTVTLNSYKFSQVLSITWL